MVKKVLLVGLIVIFLMLTASCQEKKDSGKEENNEVSSGVWLVYRESEYKVENGQETTSVSGTLFDEYGNDIGTIEYDADGDEISRREYSRYEYDSDGRLLKHFTRDTKTDEFVLYGEFLYDEQGRRSKYIDYIPLLGNDVERVETEYEYYDDGCIARRYYYYNPDSLKAESLKKAGLSADWREEYEYDTKERRFTYYSCDSVSDTKVKKSETVYNSLGKKWKEYYVYDNVYYTEHVYNEYGIEVGMKASEDGEIRELDPDDIRDEQGRVLTHYEYYSKWDGRHLTSVTEYAYDSAGNEVEVTVYGVTKTEERAESPRERIVKSYGSSNRITRSVTYNRSGKVSRTVEYSYDSAGNLTLQVNYDGEGKVTYRKEQYWMKVRSPLASLDNMDFEQRWGDAVRLGQTPGN